MKTGIIRNNFLQHYHWQNWNISLAIYYHSCTNNPWSSALKRLSFISLHEGFTKWTRIVTFAGVEDTVATKPYQKYQQRMENGNNFRTIAIIYHFLLCRQIIFAFRVVILQNIIETSSFRPTRSVFENS